LGIYFSGLICGDAARSSPVVLADPRAPIRKFQGGKRQHLIAVRESAATNFFFGESLVLSSFCIALFVADTDHLSISALTKIQFELRFVFVRYNRHCRLLLSALRQAALKRRLLPSCEGACTYVKSAGAWCARVKGV
jgi:hypothetical protein